MTILTQALTDGTNTYIYGNGRIAQLNTTSLMTDIVPLWDYYLPDALGSVRQLTNGTGAVTYARAYDPYGVVTAASGASGTPYGYTNEYTSQGLVYLRSRYYDPGMGRFLTRDTWMGDYNSPLSLNRWMYVEGNPIIKTDPSGNIPKPPPPYTPLLNPGYARKIQQNLYLLGDPSKAPGWDKFLATYVTQWNNSGQTIWWQNILCQDEPQYDRKEIVMAIAMAKEWSGFINNEIAKKAWSEATGRRYWQNCSNLACQVLPNWTASNAFLNFLSYDEAIRKMTMTDYSLVFMQPSIMNTVLDVAMNITRKGLGMGGKLDNRPYEYFCTNCSGVQSPPWLTGWLDRVVKKGNFGMKSYSTDGEMQVAFAAGGPGIFTVVLTPKQKGDLCGQQNCFDPTLKKPEWMK